MFFISMNVFKFIYFIFKLKIGKVQATLIGEDVMIIACPTTRYVYYHMYLKEKNVFCS